MHDGETMQIVFIDLKGAYDNAQHPAILNKLVKMGVKGKMLRWVEEYLESRSYQVYYQGECSEVADITSGVPQGAILSPLLFNVLVSDIPKVTGVKYADDMIYAIDKRMPEATRRIQGALNEFEKWTKKWGQIICKDKTKHMCFSPKKVIERVHIQNKEIELVKEYKYLGLYLDAPKLKFDVHTEYIKNSCFKRINLLKSVASFSWGADRETLTRLYRSLILSRIEYASSIYCSDKNIEKLEKTQNECLRRIIGARKTSPVVSLQAEANIPPLSIYLEQRALRYYFKLLEMDNEILKEVINDENLKKKNWRRKKTPFCITIKEISQKWKISGKNRLRSERISIFPPWSEVGEKMNVDFGESNNIGSIAVRQIFTEMQMQMYRGCTEVYTHGSKGKVVSAALYVPSVGHKPGWKLHSECSVLTAELFAIKQAVDWIMDSEEDKGVIYTDFQAAIYLLKNKENKKHRWLTGNINYNIEESLKEISVQFVPGHSGILRNETVDRLAKQAQTLGVSTYFVPDKEDRNIELGKKLYEVWQQQYEDKVNIENKGKHLKEIKTKLESWPWVRMKNRKKETIMARMRIGHIELNSYLHRFNQRDSPYCMCGLYETVKHYLLECRRYNEHRRRLKNELQHIGVN